MHGFSIPSETSWMDETLNNVFHETDGGQGDVDTGLEEMRSRGGKTNGSVIK